jgi:hypothetical protein
MKRASLYAAVVVVALLALTLGLGAADSVPAKRLVSGEVVSLYAYLAQGLRGVENRDAGVFQIQQRGLPVAIVEDSTGDIYVAVYKGPTSAAAKLAPLMGAKVNAQGPVYEKNGLKVLEIQIVAEQ